MGLRVGAVQYFSAFGECLSHPEFVSPVARRPLETRLMPVLAIKVLWNHLLALIELQGLDPIMHVCIKGQNAMQF